MNSDVIAAEVLKISVEEAKTYSKEIVDLKAKYYWNPKRGGAHVIIAENSEKLAATSSVSYAKLLEAFIEGRRN